jgi:endonuclease YncB( thermonuclease family)
MAQDAAGTATDPAQTQGTHTQVAQAPAAAAATMRTGDTLQVRTPDVFPFPKLRSPIIFMAMPLISQQTESQQNGLPK